jgi:hypothetical protein
MLLKCEAFVIGRERWGDEGYAREELVAERGSAFLCADLELALEPREDHMPTSRAGSRSFKKTRRRYSPPPLTPSVPLNISTACSRRRMKRPPLRPLPVLFQRTHAVPVVGTALFYP